MTPVIPSSTSNSLIPGAAFTRRKNNGLTRCYKFTKQTSYAQELVFPLSTSVRLFPHIRTCILHQKSRTPIVSATGTDVAVEESESPVADKDSKDSPIVETSENISSKADAGATQSQSARSRNGRKSEMPPVKNEELVPGATFTGKVRSIQPFGAFVDFGAFTDGLVHVSNLSDSFVKDVGKVVSIGQEVKVRLIDANTETGRISLTMRDSDDISKLQQSPADSDKTRPPRRNARPSNQKTSKFVKGQDLEGKVKNLARAGCFISLPDGEEGFLPTEEEADDGLGSMMGNSSLQVDQEVSVRVLRISRGKVTLTMKKEENVGAIDSKLTPKTVHTATNPFLLAFRKNKDIAAFLDEREKEEDLAEESKGLTDAPSAMDETAEGDEISLGEVDVGSGAIVDASTAVSDQIKDPQSIVSDSLEIVNTATKSVEVEAGVSSEIAEVENAETEETIANDESAETLSVDTETSAPTSVENEKVESGLGESISSVNSNGQIDVPPTKENTSTETQVNEAVENQIDNTSAPDEVVLQTTPTNSELPSGTPAEGNDVIPIPKQNGSINNSNAKSSIPPPTETTAKAGIPPALVKQLRNETSAGMMDCKNALSETGGDIIKAQEYLRKKGLSSADKKASRATAEGRIGSYIHDGRIGVLIEANCETDFVSRGDIFKELVDDLAMQVAACPQVQYVNTEDVPKETLEKEKEIEMQREDLLSKPEQIRTKIVEGRIKKMVDELALLEQPYIKNDKVVVKDVVKQTIALIGENMKVKRFVRFNLGEGLEKKSQDFAAEVAAQTAAKEVPAPLKEQPAAAETKESEEKVPKATISAALVKQLREETGAGMMDCKKALSETEGDLAKAQEYLRKKGLSAADKKSSRIAAEGRIGSYIHDSRIGVLIEVNCETDFVGRSKEFKELVDDLAMQVVASTQVQYVSVEDILESVKDREKEMEMQREDILSKPENIRERIVEGRVSKRLGELALLEQPFIKDDKILVKDLVKLTAATLGENVKVRRFVRFTLGEDSDTKTETEA